MKRSSYEITEDGRVFKNDKELARTKDKNGYLICNYQGRKAKVHRLVASKFIPNKENLKTVNHIDGDKENNNVSNLEWATQKDNVRHAWATGLCSPKLGESHGRSVLDDMKVLTIRTMPRPAKNGRGGVNNAELSDLYQVSRTRVGRVRNGQEWKHLPKIN